MFVRVGGVSQATTKTKDTQRWPYLVFIIIGLVFYLGTFSVRLRSATLPLCVTLIVLPTTKVCTHFLGGVKYARIVCNMLLPVALHAPAPLTACAWVHMGAQTPY